jgi:hypothetical protein
MIELNSDRSPARMRMVGTVNVDGSGCTSRRCSYDTMKNVRSRMMGPVKVAVWRL